jgi:hypothetical protein
VNPRKSVQRRRDFLRQLALAPAALLLPSRLLAGGRGPASTAVARDLELLREMARKVLDGARIPPGGRIPGGPTNTTGCAVRVPGATQNYYPAFWIRDAAMMLGGDLVPADEIEGWVRLTAATQPGADGLRFGRLFVPPFSIPDHITLVGEACWYPGAYIEQGNGSYGFLPPADDAFFFIQMVFEHWWLTRRLTFFQSTVKTGWGTARLSDVCEKAFASVAADEPTGLVVCDPAEGRTRVDWGFCDAIRKSGLCLMPSLFRWRAARELAVMLNANGKTAAAKRLRAEADKIRSAIPPAFYQKVAGSGTTESGLLLSATGLGRKDDVWASAFALWLGLLEPGVGRHVARHLLELYEAGGTVVQGQARHLPPTGEFGGHWEQAACPADEYQNGGYWATPTGWLVTALRRVKRAAGDRLLAEFIAHVRANRAAGAPWEWIQPARHLRVNPLYGSSAGLVYNSLLRSGGGLR